MRKCVDCDKVYDDSWKICLQCSRELVECAGDFKSGSQQDRPNHFRRDFSIFVSILGLLMLLWWGICGKTCSSMF